LKGATQRERGKKYSRKVKMKSNGRNERLFTEEMEKEHRFVRRFLGFAGSSFS
jgi:hypothetical protein